MLGFFLRFAFLVVLLSNVKMAVAEDASAVIKKMMEVRAKQNSSIIDHINSLPKTAILVSIETVTKTRGQFQKSTVVKLCSKQPEGGYLINLRSNGSVDVYLCNERYNAMLSKNLKAPLISSGSSKVDITQLKYSRISDSRRARKFNDSQGA